MGGQPLHAPRARRGHQLRAGAKRRDLPYSLRPKHGLAEGEEPGEPGCAAGPGWDVVERQPTRLGY
jgi:hypothetical protein